MTNFLPAIAIARHGSRLGAAWCWAMSELHEMQQRARTRRELRLLLDYEFRDLGVSRSDALEEAQKPFWRR